MPAAEGQNPKDLIFEEVRGNLQNVTKEPQEYLSIQPERCKDILLLLDRVYKLATHTDADNQQNVEILPELVLEDMDEEQIWQQLELRNTAILSQALQQTAKTLAMREENFEIRLKEEGDEEDEHRVEDGDEMGDEEHEVSEQEDDQPEDDGEDNDEDDEEYAALSRAHTKKKKTKSSIVDDKFFKLSEMEEFLEAEDAKEMKKQKGKPVLEDDGIDYFAEDLGDEDGSDDDEDEAENANYKDFFEDEDEEDSNSQQGKPVKKGKAQKDYFADDDGRSEDEKDDDEENMGEEEDETDLEEGEEDQVAQGQSEKESRELAPASDSESADEEEDQEEEQPKSTFEMRQERLKARIREYEEERLGEKPWQMKGEVQATDRPENSVLEEILEFEAATRPAPVITEEVNRCLEDIIKQRIRDQAWDDVERQIKPIRTPQEYRKELILNQEKSKESLAQIYEKEYQKEMEKLNPNQDDTIQEEPKEHKEIRAALNNLFIKLDALTNFHFTPKPVAPEPKIITNTPALEMEEVAPVAVSDATLLAPEEVFRGPKHELQGKSERNRTDKNRERRKKKQKQKAIHKALEEKDLRKQKLGIPLSKKEEKAKLLKKITKNRNVQKLTTTDSDNKALKSSSAFFSKLQDATSAGGKATKKKAETMKPTVNAKKLKL